MESSLVLENPEAQLQMYEIPINFYDNKKFEELSFPDKFSYGDGGYHTERETKLLWRKYFNQW